MGIGKYIKMTFIDDIKKSVFYMSVLIFSIVIIFNIFNIALNKDIISTRSDEYTSMSGLGFIIMAVSVMFIIFANSYYMEDKYKEYAIISVSGRTMSDICKIMLIRSSIVTIISICIGCALGICTSSGVAKVAARLLGVTTDVNRVSQDAVITTVLVMITELEGVFLINTGNMYRSNINELVNRKKRVELPDMRKIKLKDSVYVSIYLLPLIASIIPMSTSDRVVFVKMTLIVGLFGVQGVVRYVIPDCIQKYRNKRIINDRFKLIELSNLYVSIQKSISLILVMISTIILTISIGSGYENGSLISSMALICYGLIIVIMSLTVVYKFLIEGESRKSNFEQLKLLGYTKKEIKKIIFEEVILYYCIIMMLVIPYNTVITISSVMAGLMNISVACLIIFSYIAVLAVTGVVSYKGYSKIVL